MLYTVRKIFNLNFFMRNYYMNYENKYIKYKAKYIELKNTNNQIGGSKNIVFLFFNGGGLSKKQWFEHPYKGNTDWLDRDKEKSKTDLIDKIKNLGDVYLHTPKFYLTNEDTKDAKKFNMGDLDLVNYSKNIFKKIKKYKKIFIISHSRGNIMAKFFCQLYSKKIIGYVNIDGGESDEWIDQKLNEWSKKYDYIDDIELNKLFNTSNSADISRFVKYKMYEQDYKNKYDFNNINMCILNNIYNDGETSITDNDYVNETLISKFNFNKKFENNKDTKSIYYVGKTHYLYFYDDVENDIMDFISKILNK